VESSGTHRRRAESLDALRKIEAAQESDVVEQALSAARERLMMDAAYITSIDPEYETIHAVVGPVWVVDRLEGAVVPLEQSYCMRMLSGEIPNVVPDTRAEPALRELPVTRECGAYIGVPVRLSDGRVHGTFCCVSTEPKIGIGVEELHFMQVLADIVAARVEEAQGDLGRLTERLKAKRRKV
jgi:GAF domain-containing protein